MKEQFKYTARRAAGLALAGAMTLAALPLTAHAATSTYNGSATGVIANLLGTSATQIADTGPLPSSGGSITTSSSTGLNLGVGQVTADVLPSSTSGSAGTTNSSAQVSNAAVNLPGVALSSTTLNSSATATCGANGATASGASTVAGLIINGVSVTATGAANQVVTAPGATIVINEQLKSVTGNGNQTITVNALHVILLNGSADVVFAQSIAGITCSASTPPPYTYNGSATGTIASLLGASATRIADTGSLPSSGGSITTFSSTGVNLGIGQVTAGVLSSSTGGTAGTTTSSAKTANAAVNLPGVALSGATLNSSATATCGPNGATASGSSTVVGLVLNGTTIAANGSPNQTITVPGVATIVINEQIPSSTGAGNKTITVNALHVTMLNSSVDAVFGQSIGGITCSASGPTAAAYGRLSVRTVHALHTLRWHAARHVFGFQVFAGSMRLDSRLITSHTAWYHFSTRHSLAGLRIVPVLAH